MENNYGTEFEFLDELDESLMSEFGHNDSWGKWVYIFRNFMKSDKRNCVITFKNKKERASCISSLNTWKNKHDIDLIIGNYSPGIRIYIVKGQQLT